MIRAMDTIDENIRSLLDAIIRTDIYQEYRMQEENLDKDPQLQERVNAFRSNNYRIQNECDKEELFEVMERMEKESSELRSNPEVNAYLDAELALCKMMQKICIKLTEGIDMNTPDVDL